MYKLGMAQLTCETLLVLSVLMIFTTKISGDSFLLLPIFLIILFFQFRGKIKISKRIKVCATLLYSSCIIGVIVTGYSPNFVVLNFTVLILWAIFIDNICFEEKYKDNKIDLIYWIMLVVIVLGTLTGTRNGNSIILFGAGDKNYTAIYIFLFFLYSNKKDKIFGIVFSIVYALFFINSRSFVILVLLFYVMMYFRNPVIGFMEKHNITYFKIMIFLFAFIMLFSVLWVYVISSNGVLDYHESWNDNSNRIRFVSNLRSFIFLFEDLSKSLFNGYGYEYVSKLGVDVTYSQLPTFLGTTVLQAHNSYLNFMAKAGIIPSIVYFFLLGTTFNKVSLKENLFYIVPYLINAMFMHSLLNGTWLILLVSILIIPQKKGRIWKAVSKFKMPKFNLMRN